MTSKQTLASVSGGNPSLIAVVAVFAVSAVLVGPWSLLIAGAAFTVLYGPWRGRLDAWMARKATGRAIYIVGHSFDTVTGTCIGPGGGGVSAATKESSDNLDGVIPPTS